MANKVTIKDMFNEVIALAEANGRQDIVDFAKGRIEVLNKKSTNKKPTATQLANESLKAEIANVLADGKARTVSEIIADGNFADGTTTQKISALLTLMKNEGKVDKTIDKKKSYFTLAEVEDSENSEE